MSHFEPQEVCGALFFPLQNWAPSIFSEPKWAQTLVGLYENQKYTIKTTKSRLKFISSLVVYTTSFKKKPRTPQSMTYLKETTEKKNIMNHYKNHHQYWLSYCNGFHRILSCTKCLNSLIGVWWLTKPHKPPNYNMLENKHHTPSFKALISHSTLSKAP